ncbi:MAG: hypothetical protein HY080_09435 [Gammaproteobacteria bacterium]|nr:hypothetical protein [Gammaproteobacteria bacterium]
MIGKKNIAFGFLYLVLTAALGPYMVANVFPGVEKSTAAKQAPLGRLQDIQTNQYEENMEKVPADTLAKANTDGILALNNVFNASAQLNSPRSVHAHGNLESVLNVIAGLVLCFIAIGRVYKQIISGLFILGALLHSGMLYLANFGQAWAYKLLVFGPWLLLLAFLSLGIAAAIGFKGEIVQD